MDVINELEAKGESDAFIDFQECLSRVAPIERPVLVLGERGTGKELAAKRLHFLSKRWDAQLITVNCAALTPSLLESELFGHEAGAFTGAARMRVGRFEAASGGTLFLDELGNVPLEVQEKILRAVEYGEFERVGSSKPVRVDVRLIAATNADLPKLAKEGKFKADLLDRLSFEVLHLPPLRERRGDIELLVNLFAARMTQELGWEDVPGFTDDAWAKLESYAWPGNIRELKNTIERSVYRSEGGAIDEITFDPFARSNDSEVVFSNTADQSKPLEDRLSKDIEFSEVGFDLRAAVADLEKRAVLEALERCRHNQAAAARFLGLGYHQFRGVYRKYQEDFD
ncbi:phage shock protein operon transcriptional activator [Rubellicoccus peritrichatus]|uniref:Phage shock protein operon transcriptional activator n=1 Tax=Rubellicoccus peritrichatus TaxID=3080537 RepID=A0AAQ3LFF5_9BACT|nr:phage shock protein operon transcriptional activator [Puniceicoccus sp. CR14]WOO42880.1 phage shock protein operon transcriptional activator [Puniceicoccus sp. CR14]